MFQGLSLYDYLIHKQEVLMLIKGHLFPYITSVTVLFISMANLLGCRNFKNESYNGYNNQATTYHTGDNQYERPQNLLSPSQANIDAYVYVASPRLNIRSEPNLNPTSIVGTLELNDVVQITDNQPIGESNFLAIRIIKSRSLLDKNKVYYASLNYLSPVPVAIAPLNSPSGLPSEKIFVVVNIATEKIRVYQPCQASENCINKLLFEQDVVNGEDDDGRQTSVGHYRLTNWEKFYETPGVYPAWYKADYPELPPPGAPLFDWFSSSFMPNNQGEMRGAFGWYTAKVGPNPNGQWLHGTAGWGQDKQRFILFKNTLIGGVTNLFSAIRSHGCTRIDNESIAYLRSLLPIGTTYLKIYAKEAYRDAKNYTPKKIKITEPWSYILTKKINETAAKDSVLKNKTSESEWIEQGTLSVLKTPTAVSINSSSSNLYKIPNSSFKGYFIVDEGTLLDYQHPKELSIGGYSDHTLPNFIQSTDKNITIPLNFGQGDNSVFPGH